MAGAQQDDDVWRTESRDNKPDTDFEERITADSARQ